MTLYEPRMTDHEQVTIWWEWASSASSQTVKQRDSAQLSERQDVPAGGSSCPQSLWDHSVTDVDSHSAAGPTFRRAEGQGGSSQEMPSPGYVISRINKDDITFKTFISQGKSGQSHKVFYFTLHMCFWPIIWHFQCWVGQKRSYITGKKLSKVVLYQKRQSIICVWNDFYKNQIYIALDRRRQLRQNEAS